MEIGMVLQVFRGSSFPSVTVVILILALSFRTTVNAEEKFCPDEASVDLTNATRNATGFISESGNFFPIEIVRKENGAWRGCMCDVKPCVPICYSTTDDYETEVSYEDYSEFDLEKFPQVYTTNLSLEYAGNKSVKPEELFHIFVWNTCMDGGAYWLRSDKYDTDEWYLLKNGSLFCPHPKSTEHILDWTRYCFDNDANSTVYIPMVCAVQTPPDPFRTANYIGGLISAPFLIVTIFVYSILPKLKNTHGNTFRCYLVCLLAGYLTLGIDQLSKKGYNIDTRCLVFGFLIYFSFLTAFFWLNVMCFDMWWKFRCCGSLRMGGKLHDRKKFIWYSIYAWGIPTLLIGICICLEYTPKIPGWAIKPGFTELSCWFSTKTSAGLFYFGPMGLTLICNICLFVLTSIELVQHKRNIQRQLSSADSKRHDDNKLLFSLYLKLFVIMGISWSMEVISWLWEGPKYVWYFTDMVNALQGVLIFVIFVCKKKIWNSVAKQLKCSSKSNRDKSTITRSSSAVRTTTTSSDDLALRSEGCVPLNIRTNLPME